MNSALRQRRFVHVVLRLERADVTDAGILAGMNRQMIEDEGYEGRLSLPKLKARMKDWLGSGEYEAVFFMGEDHSRIGYALYQKREDALFFAKRQVYLRHFFIARDRRRKGIGTQAFEALKEHWNGVHRVDLHVLIKNKRGVGFWRSLGFKEYQFGMELEL